MSRQSIHPLTEDEWAELACAADEAHALATVMDLHLTSSIGDARQRLNVEGGCVAALRRVIAALVARLNELEPA